MNITVLRKLIKEVAVHNSDIVTSYVAADDYDKLKSGIWKLKFGTLVIYIEQYQSVSGMVITQTSYGIFQEQSEHLIKIKWFVPYKER